jgi:acyl carrier protein
MSDTHGHLDAPATFGSAPSCSTSSWPTFAAQLADIVGSRPEAITPGARVVADLGCDSLAIAEIVAYILGGENEFRDEALRRRGWHELTVGELHREWESVRAGALVPQACER